MKKLLLALLLISSQAFASDCANLYPESKPIIVENTVELCNSFFVSLFDKEHNRVILVAEHLRHDGVGSVKRTNDFHSDMRIGKHPSSSDYTNTGYDRGHMAPAGDASNDKEMHETFLMTNMTPQKPTLNRESWKMLEEHTRTLFSKSKSDMYVVNIAVYKNDEKTNGISIPSGYWKIVTVDGVTKYYYVDNVDYGNVVEQKPVSIGSLLPQ
jgi:endonuclease G